MAAIHEAFWAQHRATDRLGSPFYARLMALFAARLRPGTAVMDRLLNWPGNPAPQADNAPLRLAGGLHALVLTGAAPALAEIYPDTTGDEDELWTRVTETLIAHETTLLRWLDQPPQTNEVRRSAALAPAFHLIAGATDGPLALWELGCSGGLNLRADQFRIEGPVSYGPEGSSLQHQPDWQGPAPVPVSLTIADRRGVDLAPLDPTNPEHQLRLRAYLWPDQPHRRRLTDAAISLAAIHPARITKGDAVAWLAAHLRERPANMTTVIYHTVAWQYLPGDAQARGHSLIAAAGATATPDAPLAHLAMEADETSPGAGLTLTLWPGGRTHTLARVDFHGRWIHWTGPTTLPRLR